MSRNKQQHRPSQGIQPKQDAHAPDAEAAPSSNPVVAPQADTGDSGKSESGAVADKRMERKPPFVIAKGKSITSRRGILEEGQEVRARDFTRGQETLDSLVSKGYVIRNT